MYICPICGREFVAECYVAKHLLECWKEENPFHKSKAAPRSADIETKNINDDIKSFFTKKGK